MDRGLRLASAALVLALAPVRAAADEPAPPAPAPPARVAEAPGEPLTADDRALLELAAEAEASEVIELWDERPDKPFDRDTEVRLTGEELARRGATDLATALALLPDVNVRDAGRGGWIIDIRGARKGAVRVLVDGVAVSDPYYGTFDVSTIPITDIEQIRVSTAPGSPLDGPGAPGGVVEVHTRDAIGGRAVIARLTSSSLPAFGGSVTGRAALADHLALRVSTSSTWGVRDFSLPGRAAVDEDRRATTGAVRLEYRRGARRLAVDGFVDTRSYLPPPNQESATASILVIDGETTGRVQATYDDAAGATQLQARAWAHAMARRSRYFRDAALTELATGEDLTALRTGGLALVTRPFRRDWRWVASATIDHERADVDAMTSGPTLRSRGDATLVEAAAGLQYGRRTVRVDAAVGVAAPLGLGADPWPEGKLVARGRPLGPVEVVATVARKGRTPTLRERFDSQSGNPALGPEQATHGELRVIATPVDGARLEVAPYWRRSTGSVVADPASGRLMNLGELDVRGVDVAGRLRLHPRLTAGGSYALTLDRARGRDAAGWRDDPLDLLPDHRADAWLEGTLPRAIVLTARARWYGPAIDRTMEVDGHALVEATAAMALGGDWLAVARCDDLLDVAPETRAGYRLPGRVLSMTLQGTWD